MVSSYRPASPTCAGIWRLRASCQPFLLGCLVIVAFSGCDTIRDGWSSPTPPPQRAGQATQITMTRVSAQGVLKPKGGVLPLLAPPGDRVARVFVQPDQVVEPGQPLVELESRKMHEVELDVANIKIAEAEKLIAAERAAAEAQLRVARTGLKQAETELQQARQRLKVAEAEGGSLDLLRRAAELGERKWEQLREASDNPSTPRLVTENKLEEEALRASEARANYETRKQEAGEAIQTGELELESARQELEAAELAMAAAEAGQPIDSLKRQVELLQMQVEASRLLSPMRATVLSIDAIVGQATTTMPLMHLADTSEMICEAEVNVGDLPRVSVGQTATITSPGLSQPLRGTVTRIQPTVATPQLANPFPMAPVNRHAAIVIVQIHPEDVQAAAAMLQLQVEVSIDVSNEEQAAELSSLPHRRTVSTDHLPAGGNAGRKSALGQAAVPVVAAVRWR